MTRKTVLLLSVAAVPVVLAAAFAVHMNMREVDAVARESSQRALIVEIQSLLDEHHETHGVYPETLTVLPLTYPDGGTPELLRDLDYVITQDGYSLRTRGYRSGQVLELSERGEP
jgi:hypothetical protein